MLPLGNKILILLEQKHSSLQAFSLLAFGKTILYGWLLKAKLQCFYPSCYNHLLTIIWIYEHLIMRIP
jgi:hypothetical protein